MPSGPVLAKYPTVCYSCGEPINMGDEIDWYKDIDRVVHWGHPLCVAASREGDRRG